MAKPMRFVLVGGTKDMYWQEVLTEALEPLGTLDVVMEEDAIGIAQLGKYDVMVVDASAVENVPILVARLVIQQPNMKIIVATASPTWMRAREAFHAGAVDYMQKSLNLGDIRTTIQAVLDKVSPS